MKDRAEKLREIFLSPGLRWLAERLRDRVSRGESLEEGTLTRAAPKEEERSAVDSLLGRKSTRAGKNLTVSLANLSEMLCHAGLAEDVSEVVAACFGEVANERALRDEIAEEWDAIFRDGSDSVSGDEIALEWIASLRSDGLLKRCSGGDPAVAKTFLDTAIEIWKRLPTEGVTLAELGGEIAGDTHALDRGRPLSTILLRGLKIWTGIDGNKNAESRRRIWNEVGVVIDRLSSPVLVFNLRGRPGTPLGDILALHEEMSSPAYLTYQILSREFRPELASNSKDIFVVENPSIVERAASQLGQSSHPVICTEGIP
ncbi:MAG: TIGR02679 domain-containing protein, partial [Verrucomicrobiota bacterium]